MNIVDTLAKRGSSNTDATLLKLPIPKAIWDVAIRERTKHNMDLMERRTSVPLYEGMAKKVSIHNLNRDNLRKATMFLTGHVALNYHLNKYIPDKI